MRSANSQTVSSCVMAWRFGLSAGVFRRLGRLRQPFEMDHGAQRIDHAHQRLQLQRRLAGLEIDDEAHSHTCSQRQLRLSEADAFACAA